jgi:biopolymer transport protein TolR
MAINLRRGDDDDDDTALMAEINITPLVDVMLVLLIIFMVTAPLMMAGVPLHLPKTAAARVTELHRPVVLSLDGGGNIFIGGKAVARDDLAARLQALVRNAPEQVIYVRADRALSYGQVMQVMGTIATAGFSRISLLAEQAPAPPAH